MVEDRGTLIEIFALLPGQPDQARLIVELALVREVLRVRFLHGDSEHIEQSVLQRIVGGRLLAFLQHVRVDLAEEQLLARRIRYPLQLERVLEQLNEFVTLHFG